MTAALLCGYVILALVFSACGERSPASGSEASATRGGESRAVSDAAESDVAEVELDIFSGRSNPTWALSAADTALFLQKIASLAENPTGQLSNPLGYRGFIVHVTQGAEETQVHVQKGTVQVSREGATAYYSDPDHGLERWLLETGRPFLADDVMELAESGLTS
jgi:hypothetical protein